MCEYALLDVRHSYCFAKYANQFVKSEDDMSDCLKTFANAYREAFDQLRRSGADNIFLSRFPGGCCSLATEVMCAHLIELGWKDVEYTGGQELEGEGSHAWLNCGGIIVDITADQFGDHLPTVYVGGGMGLHSEYDNKAMDVRLDLYDPDLIKSVKAKAGKRLAETSFASDCQREN